MNNSSLLGRLTKDVDLRYSQNGTAVGMLTLAVQRSFKNKQTGEYDADFIRCKAFGKTAETLANYVKKGQQVAINGRIETGSYENQQGQMVYTTEVVVEGFTFVGGQQNNQQPQQNYGQQNQGYQQQAPQQQTNPIEQAGQQINIDDSDLPF